MANDKKTIRKKKAKLNFTKGVAHTILLSTTQLFQSQIQMVM